MDKKCHFHFIGCKTEAVHFGVLPVRNIKISSCDKHSCLFSIHWGVEREIDPTMIIRENSKETTLSYLNVVIIGK